MRNYAALFPGQGSQIVGMGQKVCARFPQANLFYQEASEYLKFDLQKLCFSGDLATLTETQNAQPAILVTSYAYFKMLVEQFDFRPTFGAGHSLGEITALLCAEAISFQDAVQLVHLRGRYMKEAAQESEGSMAAISGVHDLTLQYLCDSLAKDGQYVTISNFNAPNQIVIAGQKVSVELAISKINDLGGQAIPLNVGGAFHTQLMRPAAEKMQQALHNIAFKNPDWPVLSNVTAEPYSSVDEIPSLLIQQMTAPVQWTRTMKFLKNHGVQNAIEVGDSAVLKKLATKNVRYINACSCASEEELQYLEKEVETQKQYAPSFLGRCLGIAVSCKNKNMNSDEYQNGVIEPYQKIKDAWLAQEQDRRPSNQDEMEKALGLLLQILTTKQVDPTEKQELLRALFQETGTMDSFGRYINELDSSRKN